MSSLVTGWTACCAPAAGGPCGQGTSTRVPPLCPGNSIPTAALLALSPPAGQRVLASGSDDGSVDLWYLSPGSASSGTRAELRHAEARVAHDAAVLCLACAAGSGGVSAQQQLASASADGTLRLWDCTQLLACAAQLGVAGGAAMHSVAWTADPSVLASASAGGRLCLWDARQLGSSPAAVAAVGAPALSVAAASAGGAQLLVAGDLLGCVSVWDARSMARPVQQRQLHGDAVHAVAASSGSTGGSQVASGGDDGAIMLLDLASLAASRQLMPARQEGEAPLYVRTLAWAGGQQDSGKQQLFRGGWDQAVAQVPL